MRFQEMSRDDPGSVQRDLLRRLLFAGSRKTETARLIWADIDPAQRVTTLPALNTKGHLMVLGFESTNAVTTLCIADNRGGAPQALIDTATISTSPP
ncbi:MULTISPECIES: hypothetical protein [unclassified Bradyrhizobium]|uniref:hypothetical protein n=1 Tax=unclassified Bradyrhizobium TaxID=2631580 RepID=UPI002FF04433